MSKHHSFTNTVDQVVTHGVSKGILHLYTEDNSFAATQIRLNNRDVVNFGSCSYLGLEFDQRLRDGAKEAIDRFGTQFSESRAYVSVRMYKELEELLDKVFDAHCVITPTTTLGHIANVPIMVEDADAVIMDHQLHSCVQTAVLLVKARGVHTELIRHNRLDILEERILALRNKHARIWYMADGIYSMYGDACPIDEIYKLLDRYPQLHFYVDDAHGMSIHGENGRGFALKDRHIHPKMVVATSLNKAFASGGGVLVFPEKEAARKIRTCGGPLLSSGPMQPSSLGAAIAAARIHLSPEIYQLQEALKEKLDFTSDMLKKYNLPVFSVPGAAVFFVGVSLPKLGYNMVSRMLTAGYYVNLGIFPTVPLKNTGLRFTVTLLHSFEQIEEMIATMAAELKLAMLEEGIGLEEIFKAFKKQLPVKEGQAVIEPVEKPILETVYDSPEGELSMSTISGKFLVSVFSSIAEIGAEIWDSLFADRGGFDFNALMLLERAFSRNASPEDRWDFDYIIVRDLSGQIIFATFCTTTLWKDDMLSPVEISRNIELARDADPYHLTSRVLSTGCLLTEGEHVYKDLKHPLWKEAGSAFLQTLYSLQEKRQAENIVLRDFHGLHQEWDDLLMENGFIRLTMPDTHHLPIGFTDPESYLRSLPPKSRNQLRSSVLRNSSDFSVEIISLLTNQKKITEWYNLYLNVKERGLDLNTFALPENLFQQMATDPSWDIMELSLPEITHGPVSVLFSYIAETDYIPTVIGIDYTHNGAFNIYRQTLYHAIQRAAALGKQTVKLGFTASMEKKKLGAIAVNCYAYVHSQDGYNMQVVENSR